MACPHVVPVGKCHFLFPAVTAVPPGMAPGTGGSSEVLLSSPPQPLLLLPPHTYRAEPGCSQSHGKIWNATNPAIGVLRTQLLGPGDPSQFDSAISVETRTLCLVQHRSLGLEQGHTGVHQVLSSGCGQACLWQWHQLVDIVLSPISTH